MQSAVFPIPNRPLIPVFGCRHRHIFHPCFYLPVIRSRYCRRTPCAPFSPGSRSRYVSTFCAIPFFAIVRNIMPCCASFRRSAYRTFLRRRTGRCLPVMSLCSPFRRSAILTFLRRRTGRRLPIMSLCASFRRSAYRTFLRRRTSRCLPAMSLYSSFRRSAYRTLLRRRTGRCLPVMSLWAPFRRSAYRTLLCRCTGCRLPAMTCCIYRIRHKVAAGTIPSSFSITRTVRIPYYQILIVIAMAMRYWCRCRCFGRLRCRRRLFCRLWC